MLRLALSVFLVLMLANPWQFAPPVDAHEAYLITELGNIFPIENQTVTSAPSQAVGNIAYNLMIQGALMETLDFDGMVLHGDAPTEAERENLTEWVVIDTDTKHAGAILDGTGTSIVIPRFYSTYDYTSGSTVSEISHNPPVQLLNVQGHRTVYGSVAETSITDGMEFSGTGWSIAKLGPVAGGSYRIQADVPSGASVQFITSPNNMLSTYYDGSRYVLVDGGSLYANEKSSKQSWGFDTNRSYKARSIDISWFSNQDPDRDWRFNNRGIVWDTDPVTTDLIRKMVWSGGRDIRQHWMHWYYEGHMLYVPNYHESKLQSGLPVYVKDTPDISFTSGDRGVSGYYSDIDRWGYEWNRVNNNRVVVINDMARTVKAGSPDQPFGTTEFVFGADVRPVVDHNRSGGYNKITKVSVPNSFYGCGRYVGCDHIGDDPWHRNRIMGYDVNVVGSVTIKDRRPYDAHQTYTSDFTIDQQNPSNAYILVKPGGNTVTVKGVSQITQSDVIFGLIGAPGDAYYSLTAGGNTIYGKTTPSGTIVLVAADFVVADYLAGGILTLYPNALKHADYSFGMVGFDMVNDATFRFGNSNLIHVPDEFVKVRAWADVYVTDVTLANSRDSVTLHYLSGQYDAGDIITVPYVKLYDNFRMTINGQTTLPMNFTDVPRVI